MSSYYIIFTTISICGTLRKQIPLFISTQYIYRCDYRIPSKLQNICSRLLIFLKHQRKGIQMMLGERQSAE